MNIYFWITMAGSAAMFFPIALGLQRMQSLTPAMKFIVGVCLLGLLVEIISYSLNALGKPNTTIANVFLAGEFLGLVYAFRLGLRGFVPALVFYLLMGGFLGLAVVDAVWIAPFPNFLTTTNTVGSLILLLLPLLYFFRLSREIPQQGVIHDSMFWLSICVLIYFSGRLILFAFSQQLNQEQAMNSLMALMLLHTFLNFLHYILYGIAIWMNPRT